jgi:predicted dehydrogenase
MIKLDRRSFLKTSLTAAASLSLPASIWAQTQGANDDIRVAVVGFNGQGKSHISSLRGLKGVRIVALCDADSRVLNAQVQEFDKRGEKVAAFTDVRKLLESKEIDAISTATPNHWHALLSIWACQAGKDVYVEKPVSHNVWEGRKIVEAARKYGRIVQTGTQCRSNPGMQEMMQYIHDGKLGKVKVARGLCYKRRASIGKTTGDQPVPDSVDYDLWLGPAPKVPLRRQKLHYDWHWVWDTGCGDLGNQGIHQMDLARWALKADALSPKVLGLGGRFGYVDDAETPNTELVVHDYGESLLIFEVRGLPVSVTDGKMDTYRGASIGVVVDCEEGSMVITSYHQGKAFDKEGKEIRSFKGEGSHHGNFIKAVRSRKHTDLNADILEGHLSSALCHTGNISYRLGSLESKEAIEEKTKACPEALEACHRAYEHLQANEVDIDNTKPRLGQFLKMDPKTERFIDNDAANEMLTRNYRAPFVVPDKV